MANAVVVSISNSISYSLRPPWSWPMRWPFLYRIPYRLNRAKNYCCPALGIDLRGSIVLDQGGIDQGKPVFGTFNGERDEAKVMGNPSKNPYSKSDSISYMVCDLPPGGRDQNIFSPFQALSRQWELVQDQSCVQSPSHHIISDLKNSPPQAI